MIQDFYALTKPGIIYGNALTAAGAFIYASQWQIDLLLFLATVGGLSLVIASACVCNNYLDRSIDAKMKRTQKRALVTGTISVRNAMFYATVLGALGFLLLTVCVNALTAGIGLAAFISYVALYGIAKRRSVHGTLVGSIAGAAPPVVGYTAVMNRLDTTALILFLILVCWQMPHFYAIAIYRLKEYKAAAIPVLPAIKGTQAAKIQIIVYIVVFIIAACSLTIFGYAGYFYAAVMLLAGIWWLYRSLHGFKTLNDDKWARQMFGFSLLVLLAFSATLTVANSLP